VAGLGHRCHVQLPSVLKSCQEKAQEETLLWGVQLHKLGLLRFRAGSPVIKWSLSFQELLRAVISVENSVSAAEAVDGRDLCPLS
jgi:hypothetical protein